MSATMATSTVHLPAPRTYTCDCHGTQFESLPILRVHRAAFRDRMRRDFAALVAEGGLGQTKAWERLPGEDPVSWHRFKLYVTHRSLRQVASVTATDPTRIAHTSSRWHWGLRVELLDRELDRAEMEVFMEEKRKSARRQAKVGRKLQEVALAGAEALVQQPERVAEMSGNEIAKLADVGVKIERLANQDPTGIQDKTLRFVWEGPRPSWAPDQPPQIEGEGQPYA